ncbi:hypothetical protein O3P69_008202 [Scylla paramamosain]|uniref:Uncharacterized protein n=1 Tax=Scylla paramamosain TaxID=85552 RepID=A0AAW0T2F5_SCYPA
MRPRREGGRVPWSAGFREDSTQQDVAMTPSRHQRTRSRQEAETPARAAMLRRSKADRYRCRSARGTCQKKCSVLMPFQLIRSAKRLNQHLKEALKD